MGECITVLAEHCVIRINLNPFFAHATSHQQKQLLKCAFQEPWRNAETISILGAYLPQRPSDAKDAWADASKRYQNEYISTKCRYDLTAKQKQAINAENRKMLVEVKKRKVDFERLSAVLAYYEELKVKNHF